MSNRPLSLRHSELIGCTVLDRETTEELGHIDLVWMDPPEHRVLGFICKRGLLGNQRLVFRLPQIHSLGNRTVWVVGEPKRTTQARVKPLESLISLDVLSERGDRLGRIHDCHFSLQTGRISQYLISYGHLRALPLKPLSRAKLPLGHISLPNRPDLSLQALLQTEIPLSPEAILSYGSRRVLIADGIADGIWADYPGLRDRLNQVAQQMRQEVTQQVRQEYEQISGQVSQNLKQWSDEAQSTVKRTLDEVQTTVQTTAAKTAAKTKEQLQKQTWELGGPGSWGDRLEEWVERSLESPVGEHRKRWEQEDGIDADEAYDDEAYDDEAYDDEAYDDKAYDDKAYGNARAQLARTPRSDRLINGNIHADLDDEIDDSRDNDAIDDTLDEEIDEEIDETYADDWFEDLTPSTPQRRSMPAATPPSRPLAQPSPPPLRHPPKPPPSSGCMEDDPWI